jgi:hypothetical protein
VKLQDRIRMLFYNKAGPGFKTGVPMIYLLQGDDIGIAKFLMKKKNSKAWEPRNTK